jgi:hypothetical protein
MATNAQVTPFGQSLNRYSRAKAADQIAQTGRSLPCVVVAVRGAIVQVAFQITAIAGQAPITIPNVTIPLAGSEYTRVPIQKGCKGYAAAADAYLGGMSGLGGGIATTARPPNLTALVFHPVGNTDWFSVDGDVLVQYGPNGVTLMDQAQTTFLKLSPGQIQMIAGGKTVTLNSAGFTIDGVLFDTHFHLAPSGGGDTCPPL